MLFSSYVFILAFLPAVFVGFVCTRARYGRSAAMWTLVLASAVFYGWWSWAHLLLLIGLMLFNFAAGFPIYRRRGTATGQFCLAGAVLVNLGTLAWFKYAGFFGHLFAPELVSAWRLDAIVLPLAISFFTFQKIAYLVDLWRAEIEPAEFDDFCFFVLFFPQLVAGPIVHYRDIVPQTYATGWTRHDEANVAAGLTLFVVGLCKKTFLADPLSLSADRVFAIAATGAVPAFGDAWLGTLSFGFQIYFDFSAYSDMALGLALMLGIRLPVNFDSPYKATDPVDFWRRWHISLSSWLRDYLYIPLGGSRVADWRRITNVAIVMVLGGFWHGAAWTFIVWGAMHAMLILTAQGMRSTFGAPSGGWRIVTSAATFLAVMLCWVPFRAPDMSSAMTMFGALLEMGKWGGDFRFYDWALVGMASAICWTLPNTMQMFGWREAPRGRDRVFVWRPKRLWALAAAAAFVAALAYVPAGAPFIYFQF